MHTLEGECGFYNDGARQIDPPSFQLDAQSSEPKDVMNHEVDDASIVVTNIETENHVHKGTKKNKKSKHKHKSESTNNDKRSDSRFKFFGFGKSKNRKSSMETHQSLPVVPEHKEEDVCDHADLQTVQPELVIDMYGPNDLQNGPPDPPSAMSIPIPDETENSDLIDPPVEPQPNIGEQPAGPEYIVEDICGPNDSHEHWKGKSEKRSNIFGFGKSKNKKKSKHQDLEGRNATVIADPEIAAVISGLDQSIQQAEIEHGDTGTSVSGYSDLQSAGPGFNNPRYGSSSVVGSPSRPDGSWQHVAGSSIADPDDVFVVVQSADGNRVEVISPTDGRPPKDFILPGEGTDDMPDDLDMFSDGVTNNYVPPPPPDTPPPPPELVGLF